MNEQPDLRLQARIAARLHDPPEKALVLMRTRQGHEGGTVRALLGELFPHGVPAAVQAACKRADHWASAADRMAFPSVEGDRRWPAWQQVRFAGQPVLIHPLTGGAHALKPIESDVDAAHAQALGTDHLRRHLVAGDLRRSALALWRFGPQPSGDLGDELGELWRLLPADSRVPDHTIHDHLDLAAALAGCFAHEDDGGPALLAVSIGPVQEFIAAARSVSDLWAGSHLLSWLAWQAMRVVCEVCGPEALLFPRLRGVPLADLWLVRDQGLDRAWFADCAWRKSGTDANPLFAAALPNRFTAVVPAARAREIAERIEQSLREVARALAHGAFARLLQAAGMEDEPSLHGYAQIERQLAGFPELHWAAVPWSLACGETEGDGQVMASSDALAQAMRPFFDASNRAAPGFLGSPAWQALSGGYRIDDGWFFRPNPGALYPALHELMERALAAAKSARSFTQTHETGWRCALTGEAEWITTDAQQLALPPGQRKDTVWARAAGQHGIRAGEHLSALPMLKRMWPALFVDQIRDGVDGEEVARYVVSTHTMALASGIAAAAERGVAPPQDMQGERVALPRKLASKLRRSGLQDWARVPGWLESQTESEGQRDDAADPAAASARRRLRDVLGAPPDSYYGLLLMDGDDMGAWLSAASAHTPKASASFHPMLRTSLDARFGIDAKFIAYAHARRAPNPAWHMAVSQALHHFALDLAPEVIERLHLGKLIYAGGDDVLAMLATCDLLGAAALLRAAYSGVAPEEVGAVEPEGGLLQRSGKGWAQFDGRVLRLMGEHASASAGLVIAHHQAPLAAVLRELRAAEKRAKALAGKNAWSLAVLKRGGGALHVTAHWGEPLRLFEELRAFLAGDDVSRRAGYHLVDWLHEVPPDASDLAASMLAHQMARQCRGETVRTQARSLARRLVALAFDPAQRPADMSAFAWLADYMMAAEFLARAQRHASAKAAPAASTGASA